MNILNMFRKKYYELIRECKSYVLGVLGLCRNCIVDIFKINRSKSRKNVVLVSLGGRFGSPMLAQRLVSLGFDVHVFSKKMPGHELSVAHKWHRIDPQVDYDTLLEKVKSIDPKGIFSESRNILLPIVSALQNDIGIRSLGVSGPESSNSKVAFRTSLDLGKGTNVIWKKYSPVLDNYLRFPFVVKPDRGTGSRGVYLVENEDELHEVNSLINEEQDSNVFGGGKIQEQFIEGRQFDVEGVSRDGICYPLSVTEERYERVGKSFPSLWYLFSPPINENMRQSVIDAAKEAIISCGVQNGAWHCELRIDENGVIYPIDYSNRMGYPKMVSECAGIDFLELYIRTLVDEEFSAPSVSRGTVFQHFIDTKDKHEIYLKLAKENPDNIIEFRKLGINLPAVTRFGRISIRAENFVSLVELLKKYELLPNEWEAMYDMKNKYSNKQI